MSEQDTFALASPEATYARIRHLEDLEALRTLRALYARRVDTNHRTPSHATAVAAAELFTEDAILDLGAAGRYVGHAEILNAFENIFPTVTAWSTHYIMSPELSVTGSTGTGSWYSLLYTQPKTTPPSPVFTVWGSYDDKYIRTLSGWKFKEVNGIIAAPATSP